MTTEAMREEAVRLMKSRQHRNNYTNGADRLYFFGKPDNLPGNTAQRGFSDCSSAVRAAIRAASGLDIGGNTDMQLRNRARGLVIHETDTGLPDESQLMPGDCLYFRGNPAHLMDVGHVEMYVGPNALCGHGGGTGPIVHALDAYCEKRRGTDRAYFMAVRWITDDTAARPEDKPVLRRGAAGAAVKTLQELLIGQGVSCGRWGADGEFGPATESAVKLYQRVQRLDPDGVVGPLTWAALEAGARERPDEPDTGRDAVVAPGTWTVRAGPDTACAPLGYVKTGERLPLSGQETADWLGVAYAGEHAWISRKAVLA